MKNKSKKISRHYPFKLCLRFKRINFKGIFTVSTWFCYSQASQLTKLEYNSFKIFRRGRRASSLPRKVCWWENIVVQSAFDYNYFNYFPFEFSRLAGTGTFSPPSQPWPGMDPTMSSHSSKTRTNVVVDLVLFSHDIYHFFC